MQHLYHVDTLDDLHLLAKQAVSQLNNHHILLLNGDLGTGKTTLTQIIVELLGVKDPVTSPTFTIVNEYDLPGSKKLYHFDLYRIKEKEELEEIGFSEYIDSESICIIEWPEVAYDYLVDQPYMEFKLLHTSTGRTIEVMFNSQLT